MKERKLPMKLAEVAETSNIELSKAELIASEYAPFMGEVSEL